MRARVAEMAGWIATARPALMVVDVSVEAAMVARLASVPTVYVRLNGERDDAAHRDAFRGASALLAPFPPALDAAATPAWVRDKTRYLPGITAEACAGTPIDRRILVVFGRGGAAGDGAMLADAARACPQWVWRVIGPATTPADIPANLEFAGWVDAPGREIARARIVVGAAGDGARRRGDGGRPALRMRAGGSTLRRTAGDRARPRPDRRRGGAAGVARRRKLAGSDRESPVATKFGAPVSARRTGCAKSGIMAGRHGRSRDLRHQGTRGMKTSTQTTAEQDDPVARAAAIASRLADLGARYDAAPVFPVESMRALPLPACIVISPLPRAAGSPSRTCPPGTGR
ncbi:hypothetical protein [Novosphingobium sp. ST904]|uniref:hypothetical protein n=1 Tax=Novosphingobium sp. ST904 TaxID=1684385 RepID=UPI001E32BEF8|nr:hypothetical protein [Novosphingobium sp. ST904]